jgi:hypothetical protein
MVEALSTKLARTERVGVFMIVVADLCSAFEEN